MVSLQECPSSSLRRRSAMRSPDVRLGLVVLGVITLVVGYLAGRSTATGGDAEAVAQEMMDVYYPGTEALGADEFRVTACGTGMPTVRPKQAAACWLVELGNGDKFLFDIGAQSMSRIAAMKIPMDYLDKVFIGHLHVDHMGDLPILWTGSMKMNRTVPLRVWGPTGATPEMGTRAAIEGLKQFVLWDDVSLMGKLDARAMQWEVNEFDFKGVNEVIFQENGVTIRSIPAIHSLDGSVSFILEWNGYKFAYSSDTSPNQWWMDHAVGADISVHECFAPPEVLIQKQNYEPTFALWLSTLGHTSPVQFGKIMAETEPRMAVGYHFYNDFDTQPIVLEQVRRTYSGPVTLATDYMVFNITRDDVRVRMAVVDEDIWPLPPTREFVVDQTQQQTYGEFTRSGELLMREVLEPLWAEINEKYGTDAQLPPQD
jgi:ribonuclease Z